MSPEKRLQAGATTTFRSKVRSRFEMRRTDARPTSGRAASGSGGTGGTSLRGKRHDLQDRQRRPRPVGRQLLVGDASSLRAATPSCGFSRSSTHRAPWGVAPATPRTNRCVCCAAAPSSPSSSSSDPGTDQARFELRLQPQLDTPSPLGRGSSHAPNQPECHLVFLSSGSG